MARPIPSEKLESRVRMSSTKRLFATAALSFPLYALRLR